MTSSLWCDHCAYDMVVGPEHICDVFQGQYDTWGVNIRKNVGKSGYSSGVPKSKASSPQQAREFVYKIWLDTFGPV